MNEISIIELWSHWTECTICGKDTPLKYFIPMYEGKRVDTAKFDEWAGMPVCKDCYDKDDAVRECRPAPLPPLLRSLSAEHSEKQPPHNHTTDGISDGNAKRTKPSECGVGDKLKLGTLDNFQSSTFDESRGEKLRSPLETAGSPLFLNGEYNKKGENI